VNAEFSRGRKKSLIYGFDTAWTPPDKWLEKTAILYPNLKFTLWYKETGVGFKGKLQIKGRETLIDTEENLYKHGKKKSKTNTI
jgi:hypothetical protein